MQSELGEFHLIVLSWEVWQAHKVLCNLAHQQFLLLLQNTCLYFLQFDGERLHFHIE